MTDPAPAPSQCPLCSGVDRHTTNCPEALGVWPAKGDEVCGTCRQDVGDAYTHVEDDDGDDIVTCLGCACLAAIGGSS